MKTEDLQLISEGFTDASHGSQSVFRTLLNAFSYPGKPMEMPLDCGLPSVGQAAASATLLSLLDSDITVWLSQSFNNSNTANWLRFHTGCKLVQDIRDAKFIWIAFGDPLPELSNLSIGTDEYPDESATCILETEGFHTETKEWILKGPGINGEQSIKVFGLSDKFIEQWTANHKIFPRGIDVILTSTNQIVGLPRTTHISNIQKA